MTVQIKHVYSSLMASLSKRRFEIFKFEIKGNLIFYFLEEKDVYQKNSIFYSTYVENMPEKEKEYRQPNLIFVHLSGTLFASIFCSVAKFALNLLLFGTNFN